MADNANLDIAAYEDDRSIPGPKGVEVPEFRAKLDALLQAHGRNQAWLASAMGTSSPAIAGWKKFERVPANQLAAMCVMFDLDRSLLLDPNPLPFKNYLIDLQSIGSGQRWKALLNTCDNKAKGLAFVRRASPITPRLRGVRAERLGPAFAPLPEISSSDHPVFELDPQCLPPTNRWKPANVILFLEDAEHTQCLCPSNHRGGFVETGTRWRFPDSACEPFDFDDPIGPHRAVSIICGEPLPNGIREALLDDALVGDPRRLRPAFDRLALWLLGGKQGENTSPPIPHEIRTFRFVLLPRRTSDEQTRSR